MAVLQQAGILQNWGPIRKSEPPAGTLDGPGATFSTLGARIVVMLGHKRLLIVRDASPEVATQDRVRLIGFAWSDIALAGNKFARQDRAGFN